MTVHRIPAIPDKFKKGRKENEGPSNSVAGRIQKMRSKKAVAQKIGVRDNK